MDGIMKRTILRAPFFLYLAGFALTGLSGLALAQKVTWEFHKSLTGAFDVRFPSKYKMKSIPLRIDEKSVLFRTEIVATGGEGPDGKANQKVYLVKVDQSMATRLKKKDITKLLEVDAYKYKKSAQNSGGEVVSSEPIKFEGFVGREMYVTYGDGDNKQGVRVKIMYTDVSRIEMVLTGPASSMYAFKSNDFFNSLKVYDGPGKVDGTPGENWQDFESPLGLFTLRLPPPDNSFTAGPPKFAHDGKKEKGRFAFVDPILKYKTFFNFYGYKINEKMNFDKVKTFLLTAHVAQYADKIRLEDLKIDTETAPDGSHGKVTTLVRMRPLERYPYINTILIQALFNDNGIVVLEFMGANTHVETPLGKNVFSLVKFHPEKYAEKAEASGDDKSLEHEESGNEDDAPVQADGDDEEESSQSEDATTLKANIKLGEGADADAKAPEATPEGAKPPAEAATDTAPKSPAPAVTPAAGQAPAPEAPKPEAAAPSAAAPAAVKAAAPPKAPAPAQSPAATAPAAPQTPAAVQPTAPVQPAAPAKAP